MSQPKTTNPAAWGASRAVDVFRVLPTLKTSPIPQTLITVQADFVARKFGLSPSLAAIVAEAAFGLAVRA